MRPSRRVNHFFRAGKTAIDDAGRGTRVAVVHVHPCVDRSSIVESGVALDAHKLTALKVAG